MIQYPPVGPLWASEIPARAEILEGDVWGALNSQHHRRDQVIPTATVGPLWGSEKPARAEILEGDVWGALQSQPLFVGIWFSYDSNSYCVASLGLGNTARAEILEGDV